MIPTVLSVAGYDPSGGAGVLADCKVFDAFGVHGQGVISALTCQNERSFSSVTWRLWAEMQAELDLLAQERSFAAVKIGLVQNAAMLSAIVQWVRQHFPTAFVVWDPVLKASAGFAFHQVQLRAEYLAAAKQIDLITPNSFEKQWLGAVATNVLHKGGHESGAHSEDILYDVQGEVLGRFAAPRLPSSKHGTGCMLSSAIAAGVAQGLSLVEAAAQGRAFMQALLNSGSGELALVFSAKNSILPL